MEEEYSRDQVRFIQQEDIQSRNASECSDFKIQQQSNKFGQASFSECGSTQSKKRRGRPKKPEPNEDQLCEAIAVLRNKLPERSLQQAIIKLYMTRIQEKKQEWVKKEAEMIERGQVPKKRGRRKKQVPEGSIRKSVRSRTKSQHNMADSEYSQEPSLVALDQNGVIRKKSKRRKKKKEQRDPNQPLSMEQLRKNFIQTNRTNLHLLEQFQQKVPFNYTPKNQEVIFEYKEQQLRKTTFLNHEQQQKYTEMRIFTISFINRGYAVGELRKELEAQNASFTVKRDKYKNLAGGAMIHAYRKLEFFLCYDCERTIKFLDREQMRSIVTPMLNCRVLFQPQITVTVFNYLRLGFGYGDVIIKQNDSIKLYLTVQRLVHGKNITMDMLERIGQVKLKRQEQLAAEYVIKKNQRKMERLHKQKSIRLMKKNERKMRKRKRKENQDQWYNGKEDQQWQMSQDIHIKIEDQSDTCKYQPSKTSSVSNWNNDYGMEAAKLFVEYQDLNSVKQMMCQNHSEMEEMPQYLFQQKFDALLRDSFKQIQQQVIMVDESGKQVLDKLTFSNIKSIICDPVHHKTRIKILTYLITEIPEISQLQDIITDISHITNKSHQTNKQIVAKDDVSWFEEDLLGILSDDEQQNFTSFDNLTQEVSFKQLNQYSTNRKNFIINGSNQQDFS